MGSRQLQASQVRLQNRLGAHFSAMTSRCAGWLDFGLGDFGRCQVALVHRDIQVTANSNARVRNDRMKCQREPAMPAKTAELKNQKQVPPFSLL